MERNPSDGKHVRGVNDEGVTSDGQDGGDGIYGEKQIGGLDHQQDYEQGRGIKAGAANEELVAFEVLGHGNPTPEQTQHRILLGMDLSFILEEQLDAAVHQEGSEDINDPVESLDQAYAGHDENGAHDERAQNSPEQDLVLVGRRHLKETEDQQEDEKVIDTERKLDDVSGDELQHGGTAMPEKDHASEDRGQCDPSDTPEHGFAKFYGVGAAVEDAQVQHQHGEDEKIK